MPLEKQSRAESVVIWEPMDLATSTRAVLEHFGRKWLAADWELPSIRVRLDGPEVVVALANGSLLAFFSRARSGDWF